MALEVTELVGKSSGPDNFTEMPTVGGDPIVESGSNSDGEWTRWADGTQHVYHAQTRGSADYITWSFPQPFSESPPGAGAVGSSANPRIISLSSMTAVSCSVGVYTADGALSVTNPRLAVFGRWK